MTRAPNRQSRSVGNLGDILKHAALVELAAVLIDASPLVDFVDTHAFLLRAPLAAPARWHREVDAFVHEHPAYANYAQREREFAGSAQYRCSSGLMMDALGDRRGSATLGEVNGVTRSELREQVATERLADVCVADDAVIALRRAEATLSEAGPRALLIHVDPFSLSAELWSSLAPSIDALCARASHVALVVYRYTRNAPSPWPAAPSGTVGPVAHVRGGPHEIAVYASPAITDAVREACVALGWRAQSAAGS